MTNFNLPVSPDALAKAHAFADEITAELIAEPQAETPESVVERLAKVVMTAPAQLKAQGFPVEAVMSFLDIVNPEPADPAFGSGFFVGAGMAFRFMQHQLATGITCSSKGDC